MLISDLKAKPQWTFLYDDKVLTFAVTAVYSLGFCPHIVLAIY